MAKDNGKGRNGKGKLTNIRMQKKSGLSGRSVSEKELQRLRNGESRNRRKKCGVRRRQKLNGSDEGKRSREKLRRPSDNAAYGWRTRNE